MSTLRKTFVLYVIVAGLFIAGCDKMTSKETGKVMATVNGENIMESDYQNYLQLRQQQVGPISDKDKEKKVVLDEMIEKMLLAQQAISNKLDQDPEVSSLMKRVREEILVQALKRKLLRDNPITEEDVKKRFEQEVSNTHKTEYKVRHILVKEEAEAKEILGQLGKGGKFDKLAKEKSIDTQTGKEGGALGWINQGMVVPEFFSAVIAMNKGAVSAEPVKSDFGWHIIKVDDTRPLKIPTFEQFMSDQRARSNIYRKMQDDKMGELVKDLKSKAKITVN
ncbi:MAG: peptidylprolyl isomerase [Gammaproteobacteria bacterium]|nr:peptidylprolyl isomerase [Gammaproteobacteria bacterium]MDH3370166.1 peptidylprolyl isomerase [Gammaproteobacteria bacterium]MDH3406302.1 peptidylprolyl isomerase [Gammaproteobacteria bacterium]MDH3562099.1 peptidylprolyl isomerase [Gammaproteobacteria bacterium]MDH5486096.1 peptidylprolyl isomerase [Gammaproteobacteria bacterium]